MPNKIPSRKLPKIALLNKTQGKPVVVLKSSQSSTINPVRELLLAGTWLTCAVMVGLALSSWWANDFAGPAGVVASLVAASLSWIGSIAALVLRTRFHKPQEVVPATLGAMLVRMVVVMGGGMLVSATNPELVQAALWAQIIAFFLMTLALETVLAVRWLQAINRSVLQEGSGEGSNVSDSRAEGGLTHG